MRIIACRPKYLALLNIIVVTHTPNPLFLKEKRAKWRRLRPPPIGAYAPNPAYIHSTLKLWIVDKKSLKLKVKKIEYRYRIRLYPTIKFKVVTITPNSLFLKKEGAARTADFHHSNSFSSQLAHLQL